MLTVDLPQDPGSVVSDEQELHSLEIEVLAVSRHVPSQLRIRLSSRTLDPEGDPDLETEESR
jgi:hypothetical protein